MSSISLIQFEDKEGNKLSEVLQVPNIIEAEQLRQLVNTNQDLYLNGNLITSTLEAVMTVIQMNDVEQIKKIKLSEDTPSAQPAIYCSSTYSGHEGPVLTVRIHKDLMVSTGGDKTVRFWDMLTKTQFNIVEKHTHWVVCSDVNDKYVVTGGMDKLINVFDHKGNHIKTISRHRDGVTAIKLNDDKIVSCSRDNSCIVLGIDGTFITSWAHAKPIKGLRVHNNLIITASTDGVVKVYKDYKYHCDLKGHSSQVNCIEAHSNYIITGDDNGQIIVWKDFVAHKRLSHKREVISLSMNPNGMSFASASFDKTVTLWNIETGERICSYFHSNIVYKVGVFSDLIVSCSKDRTIKMFKISKNKLVSDLVCDDEVYDFDFVGGRLVCGCKSNKVQFFN